MLMGRSASQLSCMILLCSVCISSCVALKQRKVDNVDGARFYELKKGNFSVKLTNWGASLVSVILPDKHGKLADVVLGYDTIKEYKNDTQYLGALLGRVANRIGGAKFTLNGTTYKLDANEGNNTLHGGKMGFTRRVWKVERYISKGPNPYITFSIFSSDGEEGFPGSLRVQATYMIVRDYQLIVIMSAKALNKATPVNMAIHPYWNLGGHNSSGDILSHKIKIFSSKITPTDSFLIPTGKFKAVQGTPYDFLRLRTIGSRRFKKQLPFGYDINYVLLNTTAVREGFLKRAATLIHEGSGRKMTLLTSAPGMQFYTGYWLDVKGKGGFVYKSYAGLALETQDFPNAVNRPSFPSEIVYPGQTNYKHLMLFKFSVKY